MEHDKITIRYHSGIYTLESHQYLSINLEEAWSFFSDPSNLAKITPSSMGFDITSGKPGPMYEGQMISYKIGILPPFKSNWVTEITKIAEGSYFIDEQRAGPYLMWHHEHHFKPSGEGTAMYDKVSYRIPGGPIGHLAHSLFIRKKLMTIFSYRYDTMESYFNK